MLRKLVIIKHQRAHLNALARRLIGMCGIHKSRVRNSPGASIVQRIVALNQQRLIGPLGVLVVPPVAGARAHGVRLAFAVGVDQLGGNEIRVGNGIRVGRRERVPEDGLDRAPDLQHKISQSVSRIIDWGGQKRSLDIR
jgi:hypothetical protein